jgi:nitroreductase/FMN reductase [NAD(P)H]
VATINFAKEPPMSEAVQTIRNALFERFGDHFDVDPALPGLDELARLSARRVQRRYLKRDVAPELLRLLCACALSAPSKSDLQQADILIVRENAKRMTIADLLPDVPWLREAPVFLVFLANGRRVPQVAEMRGKPFPNDHLDLFFNATVDAAIVLATFLRAAEAVGLGCCPISVIRDHARVMSELLALPEKVVPVAGLCAGWPAEQGGISPRLALKTTLHEDRFAEGDLAGEIDAYDRRRAGTRPYRNQRDVARFGRAEFYGWSEDKARQYAVPLRADFGAFVRAQGFRLD